VNPAPDLLTHYTKSPDRLFRSISALPPGEAEVVVRESLQEANTLAHARFEGERYLSDRKEIEKEIREMFREKGGRPVLDHPFYFVLGSAPWFELHEEDLYKVEIPLSSIPSEFISFTYPDSMISFALAAGTWYRSELCGKPCNGKVFRLEDLAGLIEAYGYPGDRWRTEPAARYDYYIEAQVWDESVVVPYRGRARLC
jgi:hypothetical protein